MSDRTFPDEFVPNIQGSSYHPKWIKANPAEASKWSTYRDACIAHLGGTSDPPVPALSTKYGKALVAAGKLHVSVTDIGAEYNPPAPPPPPDPGTLTIAPPQPGAVLYGPDATSAYAHAGAMVDMNSAETPGAIAVSNAGGHVFVYVDAIVTGSGGNYASLINNTNSYGPAIGQWPGQTQQYNSYGYVRDLLLLVSSGKLLNILNFIVSDNPHMAGFFCDDLGTSNPQYGYSGSPLAAAGNGYSIPTTTFYNAVIAVVNVFRQVCNAHNLMMLVNGMFDGRGNGGYPTRSTHGCSLAEGSCAEHQTNQGTNFWPVYLASSQWATASPLTAGDTTHFVIATPGDTSWNSTTGVAWIAQQSNYQTVPPVWTSFHATGLPTHVT